MVWNYEKYTPIVRDWIKQRKSNRIGMAELDQLIARSFGINDKTLRTHKKALIAHGFLEHVEGQIYDFVPDPQMSRLEEREIQEKRGPSPAEDVPELDPGANAVLASALSEEDKTPKTTVQWPQKTEPSKSGELKKED